MASFHGPSPPRFQLLLSPPHALSEAIVKSFQRLFRAHTSAYISILYFSVRISENFPRLGRRNDVQYRLIGFTQDRNIVFYGKLPLLRSLAIYSTIHPPIAKTVQLGQS